MPMGLPRLHGLNPHLDRVTMVLMLGLQERGKLSKNGKGIGRSTARLTVFPTLYRIPFCCTRRRRSPPPPAGKTHLPGPSVCVGVWCVGIRRDGTSKAALEALRQAVGQRGDIVTTAVAFSPPR